MKRPPILLIGFTKYTDKGLAVKTNFIMDSMALNPLYSDPDGVAKLTDVSNAFKVFIDALAQKGKAINYKAIKNDARKELIKALQALGIYVRLKYPGNVVNWLTSGFDVQTFDGSSQVPEVPTDLKAKDGVISTEATISYKKIKYASYYEGRHYKVGETPPSDMTATSKKTKMTFEALLPGAQYAFQIRSRGTKGLSNWSNPVLFIAR
jgi:hypothetical protein